MKRADDAEKRLCILLAVRNGAAWLPAQLDSIAAQAFRGWDMVAGDDGSTDDSAAILEDFAARMRPGGHAVTVIEGPGTGGAAHFLTLLARAPELGHDTAYTGFADQDDVWLPEKLTRAVDALEAAPDDIPCLYCSRTWVTDADLRRPVLSRPVRRPPGFRNALVQNVCSGNTIVMNRKAAELARRAAPAGLAVADLPAHDWWLYQVVTGAGGRILHDDRPSLYYRQHQGNQIGANRGLRAALARAGALLTGGWEEWNAANIAALSPVSDLLTEENRARLDGFAELRGMRWPGRLRGLARLGLYRQTRITHAAMWLAAALGRI